MAKHLINVLLIEDDPMVQEVNRLFIERVPSFRVIATASNGLEGLTLIKELQPDLVILDIFMPNLDGAETIYEIRKEQMDVDVIVISAANDQSTIRKMLQNGAVDYIIKPFKYERLQQTLEKYSLFSSHIQAETSMSQLQLDQTIFKQSHAIKLGLENNFLAEHLPKGLNQDTLKQIVELLQKQSKSLSSEEVAEGMGIARVTARRYLDFLKIEGIVDIDIQYGGVGRPVNKYILK